MIRTSRALLFFLVAVAGVLAGCSGGEPYFGRIDPPSRQVLVYQNAAEPETLDPAKSTGVPESHIQDALFEGLTKYHPGTQEPIAALATHYEVNPDTNETLLSVRDLGVCFRTEDGLVKAVDGVGFDLKRGQTLGIVGESGSGKSVTSLAIMRLIPQPGEIRSGEVIFEHADLLTLPEKRLREIRGARIAMVFQDPMTSLNPFLPVSTQLMEMTRLHLGYSKRKAYEHAITMLGQSGTSPTG